MGQRKFWNAAIIPPRLSCLGPHFYYIAYSQSPVRDEQLRGGAQLAASRGRDCHASRGPCRTSAWPQSIIVPQASASPAPLIAEHADMSCIDIPPTTPSDLAATMHEQTEARTCMEVCWSRGSECGPTGCWLTFYMEICAAINVTMWRLD